MKEVRSKFGKKTDISNYASVGVSRSLISRRSGLTKDLDVEFRLLAAAQANR